jgi:hypothetical protein
MVRSPGATVTFGSDLLVVPLETEFVLGPGINRPNKNTLVPKDAYYYGFIVEVETEGNNGKCIVEQWTQGSMTYGFGSLDVTSDLKYSAGGWGLDMRIPPGNPSKYSKGTLIKYYDSPYTPETIYHQTFGIDMHIDLEFLIIAYSNDMCGAPAVLKFKISHTWTRPAAGSGVKNGYQGIGSMGVGTTKPIRIPQLTGGRTLPTMPSGGHSTPCFQQGTPVHTSTGIRSIETVRKGEEIWCYSHQNNDWYLRDVLSVEESAFSGKILTIDTGVDTISATAPHLFWVVSGEELAARPKITVRSSAPAPKDVVGRWVAAEDLRPNDAIIVRNGAVTTVKSVTATHRTCHVYNLVVDEFHSFAVGADGYLVSSM